MAKIFQKNTISRVKIIATGGTIAQKAASNTRTGHGDEKVTIEALVASVPKIEEIAQITCEQISNIGSQDMTFTILINLARRINTILEKDEVNGVVVTHGTDTMEETAYFLNLTVKSRKPVVLTGAMRPTMAMSADGPLNLYNAVAVAADPDASGRGILVVMNDRIHEAHSLTKNNTIAVETFLSPINGLIGTVTYGNTQYYRKPFRKHTFRSKFSIDGVIKLPRVDILYSCADMPADLVDTLVSKGSQGIVIAGDGNGNMNSATIIRAAKAVEKGVIIVRSSRVPTGRVGRNMEIDDDQMGFIASDELNPAKARILLMLILLKKRNLNEIQQLFYEY
jgi:L-asparaginase